MSLIGLVTAPVRAAATLAGSAALLAGSAATQAGGVALDATSGVRAAARVTAGAALEAVGGPPARRASRHGSRFWIEVHGLSGPNADEVADEVLDAVRAVPGVLDAVLNRSVARVVVTVEPRGFAADLAAVVAEAEQRAGAHRRHGPLTLPGDDLVLAARAVGAAAAALGLGVSVAGKSMRLPGLPNVVAVVPALAEHIPAVRHQVVRRLGAEGTDLLFAVTGALTAALTLSPVAAAAEAAAKGLLFQEAWTAREAWHRHEPDLAAECDGGEIPLHGTAVFASGDGEDYANRAGWVGLSAAALIGALSRDPTVAGAAALAATPKPTRATREAFGCAMTRGLTARHDALVIRPRALRALDRVDAVIIDPRCLYTDELTVSRIRGVDNSRRTRAWHAARVALQEGRMEPGWHRLSSIPGAGKSGEVLVSPVRAPLATAVVSEARRSGARVVSVADDGLRSLGKGFDTLYPRNGSLDDTLAGIASDLSLDGATVALLTTSQMAAQHEADITVGMIKDSKPPWGADVFVNDLAAVWRILRAIPAARSACTSGVRLSMSSTAIGALMLIPGVPGYAPDSVNAGALAGLWQGFRKGGEVFDVPLPAPEPGLEWHALPVDEVQDLLPRPEPAGAEPTQQPSPLLWPVRLAGRVASSGWTLAGDFAAEMRANLADPITPILATGALASAVLGSPLDAVLVGGVLLTNAALSSQQQLHAERLLRRLLAVQDPPARRRVGPLEDGVAEEVPAASVRPGDIIEIRSGEVVPADARLIEAAAVEADESTLTGESLPVPKNTDPTPGAPLAERSCMVYAGSTLVAGTALGVVTAVGNSTEIRRAMALAPEKSRHIGLQHQLSRITRRVLPWSLGGGAVVALLGALRGVPLREAVSSGVSITVAAVPEGLPLVATLAQLSAARALTDRHVLIRNANSIEALARLDVICFDKTGTLSENRLRVTKVQPVVGRSVAEVLEAASSTVLTHAGRADHATDEAIQRAAADSVPSPRDPTVQEAVGRTYLPFQSGRPFAATLTGNRLTIKGAPEVLSAALAAGSRELKPLIAESAAEGLRVLAVAERRLTDRQAEQAAADPAAMERLCRSRLTAIGLVGLADTLRENSPELLAGLADRGIGVRLVTGDHPVTAVAIANDLGLAVGADEVISGPEWESLSADERAEAVTSRLVFARMSPEHKVEVVQALERIGMVTAMVGDGANDAAAIRAATVGIGVAAPGSDPARSAADILLLDGHTEALLDAIDEGQQLWRRVQSAVSVLLGGNLGEVAFALFSALASGRSALNARQMLLVNMLTDALPAAALAVSSQAGTDELDRDEAALWRAIAIRGSVTTAGATMAWIMARLTGRQRRASTVALIGLVCTQLTQTLADSHDPLVMATAAGSLLTLAGVISTPGISQLFGCTPIGPLGWTQALLATATASLGAVVIPNLLERLGSVLQDDESGLDEDCVEFTDGRGEQTGTGGDDGLRPEDACDLTHADKSSVDR